MTRDDLERLRQRQKATVVERSGKCTPRTGDVVLFLLSIPCNLLVRPGRHTIYHGGAVGAGAYGAVGELGQMGQLGSWVTMASPGKRDNLTPRMLLLTRRIIPSCGDDQPASAPNSPWSAVLALLPLCILSLARNVIGSGGGAKAIAIDGNDVIFVYKV